MKNLLFIICILAIGYFGYRFYQEFQNSKNPINQFLENEAKIQKLESTLKNLNENFKIGRVVVNSIRNNTIDFDFQNFDYFGKVVFSKNYKMVGTEVFIDCIVLNFDYAKIESGVRNIAFPYRVFTNEIAAANGELIDIYNEQGVPDYLIKDSLYGINRIDFIKSLQEIMNLKNNEIDCQRFGCRTLIGNAIHKILKAGQSFVIVVENTGGLRILNEENYKLNN